MKKIVRMLKLAHAIEIGAYHAYAGHYSSVSRNMPVMRSHLKMIQTDELMHRMQVWEFLLSLCSGPSWILDSLLWCIGKSIGLACHVMGFRAAIWGAKIMEIMGSNIYDRLSEEAYWNELSYMGNELKKMANKEKEHEQFFESVEVARRNAKSGKRKV